MPATQWPYQTVETRDFLLVMGAYLHAQIDVFQVSTGRYGQLRGLPFTQVGERPVADVSWYITDEADQAATTTDDVAGNLLPVLYSFHDLDKKLVINGQEVLVLEEIIASLYAGPVDVFKASYGRTESRAGEIKEWWTVDFATHEGTGCNATFFNGGAAEIECYPVNATFLLQQYQFAVGLAPSQYHRRVPGFDYSTGHKPTL